MSTNYYERKPTRTGDVVHGLGLICVCHRNGKQGWMLPGEVFTPDRLDAVRAARIIDRLMTRN